MPFSLTHERAVAFIEADFGAHNDISADVEARRDAADASFLHGRLLSRLQLLSEESRGALY